MRLPTGIQDFTKLREDGFVYVDKTMYFDQFIQGGVFFLARPRRFGKSLLLSTLKALFKGNQKVFSGLWLETNHDFKPRPVIRIDFSRLDFKERSLEVAIVDSFAQSALDYGITLQATTAKSAFEELILELFKLHSERVVVLVDEYDKPITDTLFEDEQRRINQATLKSVYGVLKPMDEYLHLVFLTGVSKIGKLSLFSDLNNLQDISLNAKYASLCGYSREEIQTHFTSYLVSVAQFQGVSLEQLWVSIKQWYNGYSWDGVHKLYCPFSFLLFLEQQRFKSYWYETGTPTFLMEMIRNAKLNPFEFDGLEVSESIVTATDIERLDPISLMFQTGYLTIQSIENNPIGTVYALAYPNEEVRQAFSSGLLLEYSSLLPFQVNQLGLELQRALIRLDWQVFFTAVNRTLAAIPYEIFPRQEIYLHSLVHLMLVSTGLRIQSQVQTALGRIDSLLETQTHFMIFEFKNGGTVEAAWQQMIEKEYAKGLVGKPVICVAVVFDLESKSITDWKAETIL
jgi:hypothetical protein